MAKPTTLKELNNRITSVSASNLEARLGNTIAAKYYQRADEMYKNQGATKLGTISIPSLQLFDTIAEGYKDELIALYERSLSGVKGYDSSRVSSAMKFSQGALLDGLCFVYDLHTDDVTLATANLGVLSDLGVGMDVSSKIWKNNTDLENPSCVAYRIDVEYLNGDQEFTFKAVNARDYAIDDFKDDTDPTKRFCLVPYIACVRLMKLCEALVKRGALVRFRQSSPGGVKIRYLTMDKEILKKYCDDPNAVEHLECNFFPLKAFFYAPVVGAPSTTAMVSRVNLFQIDNIRTVKEEALEKEGIRKVENPIRALFGERMFVSKMIALRDSNPAKFTQALKSMSYQGKLFRDPAEVSASDLSSYLHSVTPTAIEKAYRIADVEDELQRAMRYVGGNSRPMTKEEMSDLTTTLRNRTCKFIIRKKDCSFSSLLVTNDKSTLAAVYGNNLSSKFEGFGFRFDKFSKYITGDLRTSVLDEDPVDVGSEAWADCRDEAEYYGLPFSDDIYNQFVQIIKDNPDNLEKVVALVKVVVAEAAGVNLKRSEAASKTAAANKDNGIILCRSLTATLDDNGHPVEFYKNLDPSKIVSALVIE